MLSILSFIAVYVIPFLIVLTVVVAIHELGHFLVAKACGVAIDQFSIGFGKPIAKWTDKSGVEWRIGWIPLGGFVRFSGDSNDASVPDSEDLASLRSQIEEKLGKEAVGRFYHFKPVWQRALIAAAGPVANFVLALAILSVVAMTVTEARTHPIVGEVVANSPAATAGFQRGDVILRANGRKIEDFEDFKLFIQLRADETVRIDVNRVGREISLYPRLLRIKAKDGLTGGRYTHGQVGIGPDPAAGYLYRATNPVEAVAEGARQVEKRLGTTLTYLGRIFKGRENGDQLSGPIGMASVSGGFTKAIIGGSDTMGDFFSKFSWLVVQMTAMISIGVGFVNLLPIPVLDGGHLAFYAYEAIARRPAAAKFQAVGFKVGLALVVGLMLFATWNDLARLDVFRFLGGLVS